MTETAQGADGIPPGGRALRVSGEVRIRWELQDHLCSPSDPDGESSFNFAHMRTRLRFDLDVVENVAAVVEFQDVRTLGEEGSTTADTQGVDIKRAEMIFRNILGEPLMVEFVLAYGDERLIGGLEWFDQGRTYDGIRSRHEKSDFWITGSGSSSGRRSPRTTARTSAGSTATGSGSRATRSSSWTTAR